jgi:HEAT repeat protein
MMDETPPGKGSWLWLIAAFVVIPLVVTVLGGLALEWMKSRGNGQADDSVSSANASSPQVRAEPPPETVPQALVVLKAAKSSRSVIALRLIIGAKPDPQLKAEVFQVCQPLLKDTALCGPAARALAAWADDSDRALLSGFLKHPQNEVMEVGLNTLIQTRDPEGIAMAARLLSYSPLREKVVTALTGFGPEAEMGVVKFYFDADPETRSAARRLCEGYATSTPVILPTALAEIKAGRFDSGVMDWLLSAPVVESQRADVARVLEPLLNNANAMIRNPAVRALARWGTKENFPALRKATAHEAPETCKIALEALLDLKDPVMAALLVDKVPDFFEGKRSFDLLVRFGPDAQPLVLPHMNHPDGGSRNRYRELLRGYNTPNTLMVDQCVEDLNGGDSNKRRAAVEWLATVKVVEDKREEVSRGFNKALKDNNISLDLVLKSMVSWQTGENVDSLSQIAVETQPFAERRRVPALRALGQIKDPRAVDALWTLMLVAAKNKDEAKEAGNSLIALGEVAVPKMLDNIDKAKQPNAAVRAAAWEVLAFIAPKSQLADLQAIASKDSATSMTSKLALQKISSR